MDTSNTIAREVKANNAKQFEANVRQIKGIFQNENSAPHRGDDHFYDGIKDASDGTSLKLEFRRKSNQSYKTVIFMNSKDHLNNKFLKNKVLRIIGRYLFFYRQDIRSKK